MYLPPTLNCTCHPTNAHNRPYVFSLPLHLFGAPTVPCAFEPGGKEQRFADEVGALWAGFARNSSVPPQWPAYYETSDADAVIDEGGADGSGIKMTETGRHDAACELWDQRAQELWPQAKRGW